MSLIQYQGGDLRGNIKYTVADNCQVHPETVLMTWIYSGPLFLQFYETNVMS